jgi:hypothetical protein
MGPVLIGADGFIGSHLVEAMVRASSAVRAFVLCSFNSWGWLDHAPDVKGQFEVFAGDVGTHGVRAAMQLRACHWRDHISPSCHSPTHASIPAPPAQSAEPRAPASRRGATSTGGSAGRLIVR